MGGGARRRRPQHETLRPRAAVSCGPPIRMAFSACLLAGLRPELGHVRHYERDLLVRQSIEGWHSLRISRSDRPVYRGRRQIKGDEVRPASSSAALTVTTRAVSVVERTARGQNALRGCPGSSTAGRQGDHDAYREPPRPCHGPNRRYSCPEIHDQGHASGYRSGHRTKGSKWRSTRDIASSAARSGSSRARRSRWRTAGAPPREAVRFAGPR